MAGSARFPGPTMVRRQEDPMRKTSLAYLLPAAVVVLAVPASGQDALPAGPAKQVIQDICTACHELARITNAGHTHDEWDNIVHDMITMGAALKPAQVSVVTNYLTSNFPPKARSSAPTITGNVQATFKECKLPTRAFPKHPDAAADGSIWYSGQLGNVLGRGAPKTGQGKDYPLKSSGSRPHC